MNNIKIVFIDIDGTLTNNQKIITKKNIEALKILKEKKIIIVLSSGRWDNYMLKYDENLNVIDYIITNNGACIIDVKTKKVIMDNPIKKDKIGLINNYCISNNLFIIYNGLFKRFNLNDNIDTPVYQGVITCKSKEEINELVKFAEDNDLKIPYISYAYYKNIKKDRYTTNISMKNTNKGESIKYLLNMLNISKKDSLCFGDNNNDIEMFNNCGIKVAMENGLDSLKKQADYITSSNNNDGVAKFIEKYIK